MIQEFKQQKVKWEERAGVGGLGGLVLCFLFVGFIFVIMGKVLDYIVYYNNKLATTYPMSQDAINTMTYISIIFAALPFLYLLYLVINHIMVSNSETSGEA